MATCCGYQDGTPEAASAAGKFWRGLAISLSLWVILVGALIIA